MTFRKVIFWLHLIAGVVAGVVILIMCVTGAAIAFEKEAIGASEHAIRNTEASPGAKRLSVDDLLARAAEKRPGARPSAVTLSSDPGIAVSVGYGRTNSAYVDPYTGEISEPSARSTRQFMRIMTDWHRWLGRDGEGRAVGKAITGACNTAFLFLAMSGVFLWLPRKWSMESVKAITLFRWKLRGKARDWNWHNVFGFWFSPILIVLAATGTVISYRWAGDLVYKIAGSPPPPAGAGPGALSGSPVEVPDPSPGAKPLSYDALAEAVRRGAPLWEQMTIRLPESGQPTPSAGAAGNSARNEATHRSGAERASGESGGGSTSRSGRHEGDRAAGGARAVMVSVREHGGWPLFASVQLSLDPYTGAVLRRETFADYNAGRKARMWMRFLHTGEALGVGGKVVASLASLGGAVLVWTGLALAWRRFRGRGDRSGIPSNVQAEPDLSNSEAIPSPGVSPSPSQ